VERVKQEFNGLIEQGANASPSEILVVVMVSKDPEDKIQESKAKASDADKEVLDGIEKRLGDARVPFWTALASLGMVSESRNQLGVFRRQRDGRHFRDFWRVNGATILLAAPARCLARRTGSASQGRSPVRAQRSRLDRHLRPDSAVQPSSSRTAQTFE
jgi:hypothetical protein